MTEPLANKIGVANLGTVDNQTNHITIQEGQQVALIYSDPVPDLRFFQGRGAELADLTAWLADPSISVIGVRGEGGIGKSTLVAKAFADCQGFAGKFWADVRTGTSITVLAARALQELGVPPEQVQAIEEKDLIPRLLRYLQSGRYLLAIDNLESFLTTTGEWQSGYDSFLEGFQDLGSDSVLMLASREYPPKYFGWRHSRWLTVEHGLEPLEGAALLAALEVEDTVEQRAALSTQVQGNPLALSLIAGWLRQAYRSGERTIAQLRQQSNLFQLAGKHRGEANISVERVLQWSLERLTPTQQHLLTQVSVLRGAFNYIAAAMLVLEQPVSNPDLDDLERRSLLQILPERDKAGLSVFRLQPRIQEFVQRHASDLTTAHERAIAYFWNQRQTEFAPEDSQVAIADYEETFYHECQLERYAAAAATVFACDEFLRRRGYYQTLVDLYQQIHTDWQPTPDQRQTYADVCNNLGTAYFSLGDYPRAIDFQQQSLAIQREIGDRKGEANSLGNLGLAYDSLGDYPRAIDLQQQSLAIAREIGDRNGEANSLIGLGNAYNSLGDYPRAIDFQQQSLAIQREIGDRNGEAASLGNLGTAYDSLGDYPRAIDFQQQSLAIQREIGNRNGEAASLIGLGTAYYSMGDYPRAIDFQQQSLAIAREIGDRKGEANSLGNLGNAYSSLGDYPRAIDFQQQSLAIAREIGNRNGEAASLIGLGNAYYSMGDYPRAIDFQQQSLAIAREIGDRNGEAASLGNLGNAYASLGDYPRASDFQQQSLAIRREIGDRWGEGASLFNMGNALARLDHHYEALQSFQQALVIYEALKLDHMVEKCKTAIAERNQIIAAQRITAPPIGEAKQRTDDWWEKSLPTPPPRPASRPHRQPRQQWQIWGLWFAVGLAISLLVWWLKR